MLLALMMTLNDAKANDPIDLSDHFSADLVEVTESTTEVTEELEFTDPNAIDGQILDVTSTVTFEDGAMTVSVAGISESMIRETDDEGGIRETDDEGGVRDDEIPLIAVLEELSSSWELTIDTEDGAFLIVSFDEYGVTSTDSGGTASWSRSAETHLLLVEFEAWGAEHFTAPVPMSVIHDVVIPALVGPAPE